MYLIIFIRAIGLEALFLYHICLLTTVYSYGAIWNTNHLVFQLVAFWNALKWWAPGQVKYHLRIISTLIPYPIIILNQSLPIDYVQFERASKYFDYFTYLINKEVKMRNPMDCYSCGDVYFEVHKKGAAIDGIMKLFREEAAEGYSYFIVQCWFIFYIIHTILHYIVSVTNRFRYWMGQWW